jgi:hypothetical protein
MVAPVAGGLPLGAIELGPQLRRKAHAVADDAKADAVGGEFRKLATQVLPQEAGQFHDLAGGAAPVLTAEGEQRQPFDSLVDCGFDTSANGLGAGPVPRHARQATRLGPATVAVHDQRDMARHDRAAGAFLARILRTQREGGPVRGGGAVHRCPISYLADLALFLSRHLIDSLDE